jgi:hypothetical protein
VVLRFFVGVVVHRDVLLCNACVVFSVGVVDVFGFLDDGHDVVGADDGVVVIVLMSDGCMGSCLCVLFVSTGYMIFV